MIFQSFLIFSFYCDGSKVTSSDDEINDINSVRDLAKSAQWCKNVNVIEMKYNLGLVQTFIKSISEIINQYGKVIVLEDDQITSVGFLKYMNQALDMYENEERVMHVSGYMYPATFKTNSSTFFKCTILSWLGNLEKSLGKV